NNKNERMKNTKKDVGEFENLEDDITPNPHTNSLPMEDDGSFTNKTNRGNKATLHLLVDNIPYMVTVSPFMFNGDKRYYISINAGIDHVFAWDPQQAQLRPIDDDAALIPASLENAINERLLTNQAE
ncbi:MAG: hypothetical protein ABIN94_10540, partial [Ferruginibacter sp.]